MFNPIDKTTGRAKVVPVAVMRAIAVQWPPAHRAFLANRHYRALYDHTIGGTRELLGDVGWEVVIDTNSNANGVDDGVRRFKVTRKGEHRFWPYMMRVTCNVRSPRVHALTSITIYEKSVHWKVEFSGGSVWNLERNEYTIIGAKTRYWVAPHLVEARERIVDMARKLLRMVARLVCVLADIPPLQAPSLLILGDVVEHGKCRHLRRSKGECENLDAICFKYDFEQRFPTAPMKETWRTANDTATTLSPSTPINPLTVTSSTLSRY